MMSEYVAGLMVDKLVARGLIYGRLNSIEREARIRDYQTTYMDYDQRIVYEVFVGWLNRNHGVPQPSDLLPEIRRLTNAQKNSKELTELTAEQIAELRQICREAGDHSRAWLDFVAEGDPAAEGRPDATPKISGTFEAFKRRVRRGLLRRLR